MQNDFIDGTLGTPEARTIVDNVQKKIEEYARNGFKVVYTRDTHGEDYLETQEGKNLQVKHCIQGTNGWEIRDGLMVENAEVFDKGAFGSQELAEYLKNEPGLHKVELAGLCTDICVISNAMIIKSFLPEVKITVDAACCAGVTPESHKNALEAMKMCQVNVLNG